MILPQCRKEMRLAGRGRPVLSISRSSTKSAVSTEAGYTLLELLIGIAILGVLAALVGPQLIKYLGRAKSDTAKLQLEQIATSLDLYRLDIGHYPTQQDGLGALFAAPSNEKNWAGPY